MTWVWLSIRPGSTRRPCRSITFVSRAGQRHHVMVANRLRMNRPSLMATRGRGWLGAVERGEQAAVQDRGPARLELTMARCSGSRVGRLECGRGAALPRLH